MVVEPIRNYSDSSLNLLSKGLERANEVNIAYLDAIADTSADIVEQTKKLLWAFPFTACALDLTGQFVQYYVEAHKSISYVIVQQTRSLSEITREQSRRAAKVASDVAEAVTKPPQGMAEAARPENKEEVKEAA